MVAVVPPTPRPAAVQAGRPSRAAAADFGRLLQQAQSPAPGPAGREKGPEAPPAPEDRAPAAAPEKPEPAGEEGGAAPETPAPAAPDQEEQPKEAKGPPQAAAVPDSALPPPQLFVPLEAAAFSAAAAQDSLPAEPAPAPAAGPLDGPAPAGTPPAPRQKERNQGEEPGLPLPDPPAGEPPPDLDPLLPQAPPPPGGPRSSAELLDFGELLRPDLQTDVSPGPVLDQLQQAVSAALLDESARLVVPQVVRGLATLVGEGMSEMRLQLVPEDLGQIELRVRAGEGVVRGEMLVQHPEVKQLLDQHLDRLRSALHQQGLDLRGFDVGLAPEGRFGQPDRSGQGARPQGGPRRQAVPDAAPAPAPLPLAPRGAREVDYLA
jgi:hypothetical protein